MELGEVDRGAAGDRGASLTCLALGADLRPALEVRVQDLRVLHISADRVAVRGPERDGAVVAAEALGRTDCATVGVAGDRAGVEHELLGQDAKMIEGKQANLAKLLSKGQTWTVEG